MTSITADEYHCLAARLTNEDKHWVDCAEQTAVAERLDSTLQLMQDRLSGEPAATYPQLMAHMRKSKTSIAVASTLAAHESRSGLRFAQGTERLIASIRKQRATTKTVVQQPTVAQLLKVTQVDMGSQTMLRMLLSGRKSEEVDGAQTSSVTVDEKMGVRDV